MIDCDAPVTRKYEFEEQLDRRRDITIYANSDDDAIVEVYEKDGSELITTLDVGLEGTYKTYLILFSSDCVSLHRQSRSSRSGAFT